MQELWILPLLKLRAAT